MQASQTALIITKEEPATLRDLLNQVDTQLEELLLEHLLRFEGRTHVSQKQCDGTLAFLNAMQTTQQAIAFHLEAFPLARRNQRCLGMIKALTTIYLQTALNHVEAYRQATGSPNMQIAWYLRRVVQADLLVLLDQADRAYDVLEVSHGAE